MPMYKCILIGFIDVCMGYLYSINWIKDYEIYSLWIKYSL